MTLFCNLFMERP